MRKNVYKIIYYEKKRENYGNVDGGKKRGNSGVSVQERKK